jgi:hypothetical protein
MNPKQGSIRSDAGTDHMHNMVNFHGSDNLCSVVNLNRIQHQSNDRRLLGPIMSERRDTNTRRDWWRDISNHHTHFLTLAQAGLAHLFCRLFRGHAWIRTFYRGRVYLECCHCGAKTNGWEVLT